jgi:serine/threonine protein kinase
MTAALHAVSGYLEGRLLLLPEDRCISVGTSLESDFVLFGDDINKTHCKLEILPELRCEISTTGSSTVNVGGREVSSAMLSDNDTITIGSNEFLFLRSSESAPENLVIDRRLLARKDLDDYQILRKVQMSEIDVCYMAAHKVTEERVTIRMFKTEHSNNEKMVRRFLGRALVGLGLSHPRFAEIYKIGSMHGGCFVVSEFVEEGLKFERFVKERTPLEVDEALAFLRSLTETLIYARSRRIIVARRKPSGVFMLRDNRLKVSSFDLSEELELDVTRTSTYRDFLQEKFHFEAPFTISGEHEKLDRIEREPRNLVELSDEGFDINFLGRVLYQSLTGSSFHPDKATKIIIDGYGRNVSEGGIIRLSRSGPLANQPRDLLMVLARMVTADPKKRFATMAEADESLTKLLLESV